MMPVFIFGMAQTMALLTASCHQCHGLSIGRWATCASIVGAARAEGVDENLAAAVAWAESRFDADAANPSGAIGAMQVKPQFWCPGGRADGCDLARAGVAALAMLTARHGSEGGLCRYAAGNVCTRAGRRYARFVLAVARGGWQDAARARGEVVR